MATKTFFSFHYLPDNWRASQVRNMGVIEGNQAVTDNDWESIADQGEQAAPDPNHPPAGYDCFLCRLAVMQHVGSISQIKEWAAWPINIKTSYD
jgi:hypothetical protein